MLSPPINQPNLSTQIARTIGILIAKDQKLYSNDHTVRKCALGALSSQVDVTLRALGGSVGLTHFQKALSVVPQLLTRLSEDPKVGRRWSIPLAQQLATKITIWLDTCKAVDSVSTGSTISAPNFETFKANLMETATSITQNPEDKVKSIAAFNRLFDPLIRSCDPSLIVESWKHEDVNTDGVSFDSLTALGKSALRDLYRTKQLILGTVEAIKDLRKKFPSEQLRVADLGCGPIGLLALVAVAADDNLVVEAVELSPSSALIFQNLVDKLNLGSRIKVIQGDARSVKFDEPLHLIISETLAPALLDENFVSIARANSEELKEGGIFIPQQVTLEAIATSKSEMAQLPRLSFSPLLDFDETYPNWTLVPDSRKAKFIFNPQTTDDSDCSFTFELSDLPSSPCICIRTNVQVYGEHQLDTGESMITYSRLMPLPEELIIKASRNDKSRIKISYPSGYPLKDIGGHVKFRFY